MRSLKSETWIKVGYELLATEGIEGVKVERLARVLKLNKSGFYHYFGTMDGFLKELYQHHVHEALTVAGEIRHCAAIDPDLLLLVVRNKLFFLVESQLLLKRRHSVHDHNGDQAWRIIAHELIELWAKYDSAPSDTGVALSYLDIVRHFIYAHLDAGDISYESLHDLAAETRKVLEKIAFDKHVSANNGNTSMRH